MKDNILFKIKKFISRYLPIKFDLGENFTTDIVNTEVLEEVSEPKKNNLIFYQLRKDLHAFEITNVINNNGRVSYKVEHIGTNTKIIIPVEKFNFLFEEMYVKTPSLFKNEKRETE